MTATPPRIPPMAAPAGPPASLRAVGPAWFVIVMGLAGVALAWQAAVPALGAMAAVTARASAGLAAIVFALLAAAALRRAVRHPAAWTDDLRHPVRQVFVAAIPIALLLLVTAAVGAGWRAPALEVAWWTASLGLFAITVAVLARWWRMPADVAARWAGVTPALIVPVVGNVLVPLAGLPLGRPEWSAAQFGTGLLFWPVVLALLLVRIAQHGPWPERLLPANFILVAPPAAIGLSANALGAPPAAVWALWGIAVFSLAWVATLLKRIAGQPFAITHWGIVFPLAALASLTLRLGAAGETARVGLAGLAGLALLAACTLLAGAALLATGRGLRDGSLLVPEPAAPAPGGVGSTPGATGGAGAGCRTCG